jgi:hypothetical protein
MPNVETTTAGARNGIRAITNQLTTITVNTAGIEVLIGGPYRGQYGETHTYGHAALRVISASDQRIYDFGRYGDITGDFGAEGEGILRVWDSFDAYIAGENSYGRTTTGFLYEVSAQQVAEVNKHYDEVIATGAQRRSKHPHEKEYKLRSNYHGLTNNCTTVTLSGARLVLPKLEVNAAANNQGRGMSSVERMAARAKGLGSWPNQIFMPADAKAMLETNLAQPPKKIRTYGGDSK